MWWIVSGSDLDNVSVVDCEWQCSVVICEW